MAATTGIDFWKFLTDYPPGAVRLFAKKEGSGIGDFAFSDEEIAIQSAMPISRLREMVRLDTWDTVTMGEMRAFFLACRFDPTKYKDRQRVAKYDLACKTRPNMTPFGYLQRSPHWKTQILPLVIHLQQRGIIKTQASRSA